MQNRSRSEALKLIAEIFANQYFAVVTSVENKQPYSNLVAFAVVEDLRSLVFVTDRNTHKYSNISKNHQVSMLIDNRTNKVEDIEAAVAITVIGVCDEADKNGSFQTIFIARHPQLKQFLDKTDSALMLVKAVEYIIAGFDQTLRVAIDSDSQVSEP